MIVTFNLLEDEITWKSTLHQLNSDILKRHVLFHGSLRDINISFLYCEATFSGKIIDSTNEVMGCFYMTAS
jgi:hypothetical protein